MLVEIDTKVVFDDQGQRVNLAPGRGLLQAYDLADPANPKLAGEINCRIQSSGRRRTSP